MLIIDTAALPRRERAEAMASTLSESILSSDLVLEDPDADLYMRQHHWSFGSLHLVRTAISGMTMTRTQRHTARDDGPVVSIGIMAASSGGVQVQDDVTTTWGPTSVYGMELTRPYTHVSKGGTRACSLLVRAEELGLPLDLVAGARPRVDASPLKHVFASHIRALTDQADHLVERPSADMVEAATLPLARALLASASTNHHFVREAIADTLVTRVKAHVREHLQDPRMNAATIAAAHHVSVRHLYKSCAEAGMRLEQWVIAARLDAARADLAAPRNRDVTIAHITHKWGFTNTSHFTHRFRESFGMTPREWQRLNDPGQTSEPGPATDRCAR